MGDALPSRRDVPGGKIPEPFHARYGLGQYSKDNESLNDQDNVIWMTTGTTHVARAEEWPIMPTEWVHTLLKPWNFFDETPTLGKKKSRNNTLTGHDARFFIRFLAEYHSPIIVNVTSLNAFATSETFCRYRSIHEQRYT